MSSLVLRILLRRQSDKNGLKAFITLMISILALLLAIGAGSVRIPVRTELFVIAHKLFSTVLPPDIEAQTVSILWSIRIPRALSAFLTGGILAVCGAICQSMMQNPLASSYTLGVSSGASLGAAIIIASGISIPVLGVFLLPAGGFAGALITVGAVLLISSRLDNDLRGHTIILFGMIVSLFTNAILTLITALDSEHTHQLLRWQMGSFSGKRWYHVAILFVSSVLGVLMLERYHKELDIMSFGDEQALSMGVDAGVIKRLMIILTSLLTGIAVCFTGTIGFVDLMAPHAVRKIFGPSHRLVIPMSFFIGGALLSLSDLLARTILAPQDLPVGAVTALFGAPFFLFLYFDRWNK